MQAPDKRPAGMLTPEISIFKSHNFFWTPDHWEPLKLSYFEQFLFCSIHKWQELNWLVWKVQSLPCQKHNLKPGGLRANHQDPLVLHPYLEWNYKVHKVHYYVINMRQTLAFINEVQGATYEDVHFIPEVPTRRSISYLSYLRGNVFHTHGHIIWLIWYA